MPPEPVLPSRLLGALPGLAGTAPVSLAWLAASMGPAAPGLLLVLLAILSMIPTGLPVAVPFGLCIAVIGVALARGGTLLLPDRLGCVSMPPHRFAALMGRAVPIIARTERWLRPRWPILLSGPARALLGALTAVHGVLIALPIPFGNHAPAVCVLLFGLGLLLGDGAAVLAGLVASVAALAVSAALCWMAYDLAVALLA